MEIHQLRYFCAVARHGTFTQAARAERVAQPSLSQQILKLEDELGAKLFDRMANGVRLTAYGQAFLPSAQQLLRDLWNAKAEIQEMAGQERGEIAVGVIPTIAPYLLPPVLTGFARAHPGIAVKVVEDLTPALLDRLRGGAIDMAVVALPVRGNWIRSVELFWEPMFLVLPAQHAMAQREAIRLNEVKGEPFLLLKEGHCFRESAIAACRQARMQPNVVFESGQFATILAMVSAGAGISAVPAMAARPVKGCRYVRIANEKAGRSVGAVTLRRRFETRAQKVLLRHLAETCSAWLPLQRSR
jgi:LysR family transcriptional regulator, hydrogen peroxide-inducible genes activator